MNNQGVTEAMLQKLQDKEIILQNIKWKPDQLSGGYRKFYPYLPIEFVKPWLIECLGSQNMSFLLQKDQPEFAMGHLEILYSDGRKESYSAIGVEKEGRGITDAEKKAKVKYKGNVADTIKSCAEWLGVKVPMGIDVKSLKEDNKVLYNKNKEALGTWAKNQDAITAYLNNISHTRYLLSKVWMINKQQFQNNKELENLLSDLMKGLENG